MKSCLIHVDRREYEAALVDFFPALDKTAKRRRPTDGVAKRIKGFISDQEGIISAVATGNIFRNIRMDGVSFPDAIYTFGRTAISHEGELDPRLTFNESGSLQIGEVWNLPSSYITGLCIGVIVAPENASEFIDTPISVTVMGHSFQLNDLWGAETRIKQLIADKFRNPHLFD